MNQSLEYEVKLTFEQNIPISKILEFYCNVQRTIIEKLDLDEGFAVDVQVESFGEQIQRGDLEDQIRQVVPEKDAQKIISNLNCEFSREKYQFTYPINDALKYITRNYLNELLKG